MNVPACLMRKSVTRMHPAILDRIIPADVSQALHARLASLLAIQTVTPSYYAARGLDRHSCSITYLLGRQRPNLSRAPTQPTRPRARQYLSGHHHAKGTLKINSESVSCLFISVYRSVLIGESHTDASVSSSSSAIIRSPSSSSHMLRAS